MTDRQLTGAAVFLGLTSPVLMFPAIVGPPNAWMAVAAAVAALVVAVRLLTTFDTTLAWCTAALALAAVVGFVRSPVVLDALGHFCGLALGLLSMATVAVWCRSPGRLAAGLLLVLVFGLAVLAVGYRSVTPYGNKIVIEGIDPLRAQPLPMASLHSRIDVNPNVLAATAMLLLPLAVAAVRVAPRRPGAACALRAVGLVVTAAAGAIVLLMESRGTLLAAAVVAWLAARQWLSPARWWIAGLMVFAVAPMIAIGLWSESALVAHGLKTLAGRADVWQDAMEGIRSSPWVGIGFDYFRDSGLSLWPYPPNLMVGAPHAHNIVLQIVLDVGLVGLGAYLALQGVLCLRARRVLRQSRIAWVRYIGAGAALSLVSVHVFGVLDAIPLGVKVGIFQWLSSGLLLAAWRLRHTSGDL